MLFVNSKKFRHNFFSFEHFSEIKKLALTGLLAGVGVILKLIEIPTFSGFLKMDFALIPVLLLAVFATYPYVMGCAFLIDLISLRGNLYGWFASFLFSISLINGIFIFKSLIEWKTRWKFFSYNLGFFISLIITTLFLFIMNAFFITPSFLGLTYQELQSPKVWSQFSKAFFGITSYKWAMFLFYSAFNFLLKGPLLILVFNMIAIPLFYTKQNKKNSYKISNESD